MFKQWLATSLLLAVCWQSNHAQTNHYQFSKGVEPYSDLETTVPISGPEAWYSELWTIPIGFQFEIFGQGFEQVTVYAASSLFFGFDETGEALHFAAFSQAIIDRGWEQELQSMSPISYQVSGEAPDRICKIEFKNAGFDQAPATDTVSLQVWLFEANNALEVHLGPHYIPGPEAYESIGAVGPFIGFINEIDDNYELLYGTAQNPSYGLPSASFLGLTGNWPEGLVYRFTPKASSDKELATPNMPLRYLSDRQALLIPSPETEAMYQICDATGRVVRQGTLFNNGSFIVLPLDQINPGWHTIQIRAKEGPMQAFPFAVTR